MNIDKDSPEYRQLLKLYSQSAHARNTLAALADRISELEKTPEGYRTPEGQIIDESAAVTLTQMAKCEGNQMRHRSPSFWQILKSVHGHFTKSS